MSKVKTLNFEKWLESQGVDTVYFWNQCKRKNQHWSNKKLAIPRKVLEHMPSVRYIFSAFNWGKTSYGSIYWGNLDNKWHNAVDDHKGPIKFGFKS